MQISFGSANFSPTYEVPKKFNKKARRQYGVYNNIGDFFEKPTGMKLLEAMPDNITIKATSPMNKSKHTFLSIYQTGDAENEARLLKTLKFKNKKYFKYDDVLQREILDEIKNSKIPLSENVTIPKKIHPKPTIKAALKYAGLGIAAVGLVNSQSAAFEYSKIESQHPSAYYSTILEQQENPLVSSNQKVEQIKDESNKVVGEVVKTFDNEERLQTTVIRTPDGEIIRSIINTYSEDGKPDMEITLNADGVEVISRKLDENNKPTEEVFARGMSDDSPFSLKGMVRSKYRLAYDENGNIKDTIYLNECQLNFMPFWLEYFDRQREYADDGKLKSYSTLNRDDPGIKTAEALYEYDENGIRCGVKLLKDGEECEALTLKRNEEGEITEIVQTKGGQSATIAKFNYNENNQIISSTKFNEDFTKSEESNFEYEDNGSRVSCTKTINTLEKAGEGEEPKVVSSQKVFKITVDKSDNTAKALYYDENGNTKATTNFTYGKGVGLPDVEDFVLRDQSKNFDVIIDKDSIEITEEGSETKKYDLSKIFRNLTYSERTDFIKSLTHSSPAFLNDYFAEVGADIQHITTTGDSICGYYIGMRDDITMINGFDLGTLIHETGHALDNYLGENGQIKDITQNAELKEAFEKELAAFNEAGAGSSLDTYGTTNIKEFFAEIYAYLNGVDEANMVNKLPEHFPESMKIVKELIEQVREMPSENRRTKSEKDFTDITPSIVLAILLLSAIGKNKVKKAADSINRKYYQQ